MDVPPPCPWSMNQLRRLGKLVREGLDIGSRSPSYDEVLAWYDELAAFVVGYLWDVDWSPLLDERRPQIISRVKTIDTLREKLLRAPSFPLPAIQDIAGVRFEAAMSLEEQDTVVSAITGYFDDLGWGTSTTDYRHGGGHSGYRAVHVVLERAPLGKVEIQVRTHLQGQWANMYEALADRIGRYIRYDELPENPEERGTVKFLQGYSLDTIARLEELKSGLAMMWDEKGVDGGSRALIDHAAEIAALEADVLGTVRRIEETLR